MDIREISVEKLRGMIISCFAPMNGGKTEFITGELQRVLHSGYNVMAYNSALNVRDGSFLVIDGRTKFPAKAIHTVDEIKKDLERRQEIIHSNKIKYRGTNGKIVIDGIEHQKYAPLIAWADDEINLFTLSERDAEKTIRFLEWSKQNNFIGYVAGLFYDFRHLEFGKVASILPYIDIKTEKKPVCKAVHHSKLCGQTAIHTQRLWSIDFVKEQGLEKLLDEMEFFDFADKEGNIHSNEYVAAPFFDKTVRIEEAKDGRNVYLPCCNNCASLPFKEETFRVYDAIVLGNQLPKLSPQLRNKILKFLSDPKEDWIRKDRIFVPTSYYRNRLGGYSPENKSKS